MPCRDDYNEHTDTTRIDVANKKIREQQKRLDMYARLLCFVCTNIDVNNLLLGISKIVHVTDEDKQNHNDLMVWWTEHQETDRRERERIAKEKAAREAALKEKIRKQKVKAAALKKLNSEERKALGLA